MKKIVLDYDSSTKMVYSNGYYVGTFPAGVEPVTTEEEKATEASQAPINPSAVLTLKAAGYRISDIYKMKKEGLI